MAFTYDITTDRGAVRRVIGDTVSGAGLLPGTVNFDDAEIDYFLTAEGDHVQRGAAAALEAVAAAWSAYAGRLRMGPEDEEFLQAEQFAERAYQLRSVYGWNTADDNEAAAARGGFSISVRRPSA